MAGSERGGRLLRAVAGILVAALFAVPLLAMVAGSLRRPGLPPPRGFEAIPDPVTLDAYRVAFGVSPLARALGNSLGVAAVFVPVAVLVASWAGFAIALEEGRRRVRAVALVVGVLMVPLTAVWIARFVLFEALGLVGTYVPLVAPALAAGSPFFVLLYVIAFLRIPREVFDAAALEGARPFTVWRRVAMPLARGTTIAVAMLAFVLSWASFVDPLLYLDRESTFTAPLVLRYLEQLGPTNWPVLLAGSVVVTAPVVVAFAVAQRRFLAPELAPRWFGR